MHFKTKQKISPELAILWDKKFRETLIPLTTEKA